MPIDVPRSILVRTRGEAYTSGDLGAFGAADVSFLSHGKVPQPSGQPIVNRSAIVTIAQARDYARAGFHASVTRGLAAKTDGSKSAWNNAARLYSLANDAANVGGLLTAATGLTALARVKDMLALADHAADTAKSADYAAGRTGSSSTPAQPESPVTSESFPDVAQSKGMGTPMKIALAGGLGFALLAVFGRSKKDTKGASKLMGFLEGNRTRRKKVKRSARKAGKVIDRAYNKHYRGGKKRRVKRAGRIRRSVRK